MTRGPAGYGRYNDDPQHVGCPYAKSDMTPCIARDAHLALSSEGPFSSVCVGCNREPFGLMAELGQEYAPALAKLSALSVPASARSIADLLTETVREATEPVTKAPPRP